MQAQSFLSVLHRFDVLFLLSICPALGVPDHSRAIMLAITKNSPVSLVVFLWSLFGLLSSVVLPSVALPQAERLEPLSLSYFLDFTLLLSVRSHGYFSSSKARGPVLAPRDISPLSEMQIYSLMPLCYPSQPATSGCSFAAHSHALALFICLFMCLI